MIYATVGFLAALIVILVFAIIWQVVQARLDRWAYHLNRETHSRLFEAQLKLDSVVRGQERLHSQLERLQRVRSIPNAARSAIFGLACRTPVLLPKTGVSKRVGATPLATR